MVNWPDSIIVFQRACPEELLLIEIRNIPAMGSAKGGYLVVSTADSFIGNWQAGCQPVCACQQSTMRSASNGGV